MPCHRQFGLANLNTSAIGTASEYGQHFPQVVKTITVDNGSEFAGLAQTEAWGSKVFFAHPYTAWERAQNERHNGLFRSFVPKGVSIELFTDEDILAAADELDRRPRRKLGHCTQRNSLMPSWILFTQPERLRQPGHGWSRRLCS